METTTNFGWDIPDAPENLYSALREGFIDIDADLDSISGGGMSNPMTTVGDIIRGTTAGAPQRLGIGTEGYVLTVVSGLPAWAATGGLDADLVAIANLTPANDDIIQRKSGAWTNRTLAQYKTDLALNNVTNDAQLKIASNLSDLANTSTARTNLGVAIGSNVQAWDADLDAIAALAGTSGLLRKTAANTWTLDTSVFLTGNETITLSGDVTGSGATAIATTITAQNSTFWRGKVSDQTGSGLWVFNDTPTFITPILGVASGTSLNLSGNLTVSGNVASHLIPSLTDTYDLGSSTQLWRKGWLSEMDAILFAQNTISVIGGWLMIAKGEGTADEDIDTSETQIDFGTNNIAVNDFIIFRAAGSVEYMQAASLVSGNVWNVTRNVDGTGANAWPQGSVYVNLGYNGTGRIELNANSTPRIQILTQGTTYNAQTELVRMGDLDGNWGYSSPIFGFAAGRYGVASKNWLTIEETNGFRMGSNATTRMQLSPDGSGFVANSLFAWDTSGNVTISGNATIAGWTINSTRLSGGTTHLASGFDIPAGQVAWFGKNSSSAQGWFLRDSGGRFMGALTGASAPARPYMQMYDGAFTRVVIGDLNDTFNGLAATNSMGMKIWDSAGAKLAEFSDVQNILSGWTIAPSKISSTGIDIHSGASAGLAFGTTPPTSATVGTGLWLDRTGMYGLASSVQQAIFNAATGAITAGAGNVKLNVDGLTLTAPSTAPTGETSASSAVNWKTSGGKLTGLIQSSEIETVEGRLDLFAVHPDNNSLAQVALRAKAEATQANLVVIANDATGASSALLGGTGFAGFTVSGDVIATGLLKTGSGPTTLTDAVGKVLAAALPALPYARAYHNADQSVPNNTLTALALNSEREDTDVIHDTSTNNTRLTCKTAGLYVIIGNIDYAFHATGHRDAAIRLNGTTYIGFNRSPAVSDSSEDTVVNVAAVYRLAVNDYVELIAKQTSGGALNARVGGNYSPEFAMMRMGS